MSDTDTMENKEVEEIPDFDSILDQVRANMEEEPESADESEESEEDLPLEDQEEAEDDVDAQADDDQEPYQDPDEEEEPEEDESDAEPEEEAEVEPERDELAELRQALEEQRKFNHQLVDKLKQHDSFLQEGQKQKQQQQQQPKQQPQRTLETEQLEEGFRLQLFGSMEDRESYDALPPPVKKKAKEAVRRHSHEESLNILYPERRYENQIRYFVQQDIQRALGGLTEDYHARRAKTAFAKYEDQVQSPDDRRRLLEIMPNIPGYESDDWKVQEKVLKLAVDQVLKERRMEGLAERERDLEIRESQIRNSKSKRSSPKGKRGRRRSQPKNRKLSAGDDLVEFARQLEQDMNNGR